MISLTGFSRSALSTSFYIKEWETLLDCGPLASLFGINARFLLISHYHPDHISGFTSLLHLKACRDKIYPIEVYAPSNTIPYLENFYAFLPPSALPYPKVNFHPINQCSFSLSKELTVIPFPTIHRSESTGFLLQLNGKPILAYTSDTRPEVLEKIPILASTSYILIESTYIEPEKLERAQKYGHTTLVELSKFSEKFKGEKILLHHFQESYTTQEIWEAIQKLKFPFLFQPVFFDFLNLTERRIIL